ncbi:MAG: hypothetical protein ACTSQB_00720 [Candidatus Heimdallarchaeota archaeon]
MQSVLEVLNSSLTKQSFIIELEGIFDNIFNINGHIEFSKGLDFFSILFWEKNIEYPKPVALNEVDSSLEVVFSIIKETLLTADYQIIKYGLTQDKSMYLHITKNDQSFEIVLFMPEGEDDFNL